MNERRLGEGWMCLTIAGVVMQFSAAFASVAVDFGVETRRLRPELHSACFAPLICSASPQAMDDLRSMRFYATRTHDWALFNPNQRVCDYFHIFPLQHLDATDARNYYFKPTDHLLKLAREELNQQVMYRLGTSIEHSGPKVHFNSVMPEDFDKVAETFAATVRHYNRGWADGFNWGVRYWEIWTEPEGYEGFWCFPEPFDPKDEKVFAELTAKAKAKFISFFVKVLKRLKSEFGNEIKVGGPALETYREDWFRPIILACREAGVAPDFLSWHGYEADPQTYLDQAAAARKLCVECGVPDCELILDEWHYFGHGDYTWEQIQKNGDPKELRRIRTGPRSHNGIRSACYVLATLAELQRSDLDQAYYYGCSHTGDWGYKDEDGEKYKTYYALKLFGRIAQKYTRIFRSTSENGVYTLAVGDVAGRKALLVSDYESGARRQIEIPVEGVGRDSSVRCVILDQTHDLEPTEVAFKDGRLILTRQDEQAAAFFVEFEDEAK